MEGKVFTIGEICSRFSSGKYLSAEMILLEGEFPVYGGNGFRGYTDECNFDGECSIIGRQGAYCGNVRFFKGKGYMTDHAVVAVTKPEHDNRYFAYKLGLMNLGRFSGQAAQPGLSVTKISKLRVEMPSLPIQRRIASILSAYDDLIENNTSRIRLLELMADNIYKEWFVRFRFPGHENTEFENGLPKGWKVERYGNVTKISAGGDRPKCFSEEITDECKIPVYSNGTDNFGLYGYTNEAKITEECITISARGTVGFVCLRKEPFVPIVRLLSAIPKNNLNLYYLFHSSKFNDLEGNGTSQQQLTAPMLSKRKIIIPDKQIMDDFGRIVSDFYEEINKLALQNEKLARQRDLLLPRLMSGKLEVKG